MQYRSFLFLCLFLLYSSTSLGQNTAAENLKDKVEAAFIYNFLKYITWPSSVLEPTAVVTICVYNSSSLEQALHYIRQQKSAERQLIITALQPSDRPMGCHIVFISNKGPLPLHFNEFSSQGTGLLLVSDIPGFIQAGGMIGLVEEQGRLVLEVNNTALTRAGLRASARLLSIARRVI